MLTKIRFFRYLSALAPKAGRLAGILSGALVLFLSAPLKGQLTAGNYTGCPNQIITVTASWPNVVITSLSLAIPGSGSATNNGNLQTNTTFTISHPGPGPVNTNWTLTGTGTQGTAVVTSTFVFQLYIDPPPTLIASHQDGNAGSYCPGSTANIIVTSGGNYYTMVGPQNLGPFQTNVFIISNLSAAHNGSYVVTSVGTCTMTGTVSINVAPNVQLTANSTSNVCQGDPVQLVGLMPNGIDWEWFNQTSSSVTQAPQYHFNATPADAGVYTVHAYQVYGLAKCLKTATTQINVVETNPIGVAASPSGLLCQNDKLTLSAQAPMAVGYSWTGPCNFATTLSNPTISPVVPCHTGDYTVTALFTNNFVTCTTSNVVNVEIVPTTAPNANVPSTVCQDNTVQLSATGGPNIYNWVWYGPNFTSNSANPVITNIQPDRSGPYVVTAIYKNAASTKTCAVSSLPQQLTVIQVNTVSVIPPKPVCVPENAQLSASAPGAVQYLWTGPNNANFSGANVTLYYPTPAASGVYTVTAYFGSLLCPNSSTVALTVNPVLNFTLIPRQMACYNYSVGIEGPPGADSYTWTSSTGFVAYSKDILINSIQPKDAGTYTLNVSLGPCITRAASEIVVVTPIQFTLTPKSRSVCLGDTVIFEAGVTGGSENYAYTWNPPLYLDSPTGPYKVLVPQGTVQYNLMVHDVACARHFTLAHTFEVEVKEAPTPTLNLQATRSCAPLCQVYNAGTQSDAGITTFDFGGLMQYQSDNLYKCLDEPGTYTLNVITKGKNGCTGYYQYPYPLIVDPRPGSDILWNPNPATTSEEVTFYSESDYEPITYKSWLFVGGTPAVIDTSYMGGGTDTTNDERPVRRYEAFGKYPVMLVTMNEHGCFDTVVKFIDVIDEMSVFIPDAFTPNGDGVNDNFKVKGQGMEAEGFIMDIFNRKGQIIFTTKDINEPWDGTSKGAICPVGVYTYKIRIVGMNGEGRREYVGRVTLLK